MIRKKKSADGSAHDETKTDKPESESGNEETMGHAEKNDKTAVAEKKEPLTPEQMLEEQKKKYDELNDRFLRLYAEFDNYRKRTIKERVELIQTASSEVISVLLPVLDDFDRAVQAFEQSNELPALKEGVLLVSNKFRNILGQKGLEEMKSIGEVFNPEFHDAIASTDSQTEEQKGKVIDEVQKGYYLNGKILRHAKVVVGN